MLALVAFEAAAQAWRGIPAETLEVRYASPSSRFAAFSDGAADASGHLAGALDHTVRIAGIHAQRPPAC